MKGFIEILLVVLLSIGSIASAYVYSLDTRDKLVERSTAKAIKYAKFKPSTVVCFPVKSDNSWAECSVSNERGEEMLRLMCPASWKNQDKKCYSLEILD